jgi:hypothetical protein
MTFADSKAVWEELFQDVTRLLTKMKEAPEEEAQFWRRSCYRSLFGMIEAWLSFIRGAYSPL